MAFESTNDYLATFAEREAATSLMELRTREDSSMKVELLLDRSTSRVYIRLEDKIEGRNTTQRVPNEFANHAFDHPYVYIND
jgi:hypothetical protein